MKLYEQIYKGFPGDIENLNVLVYRNLTRQCWSIRSNDERYNKGKVIFHARDFFLNNCYFTVSEAGRSRVIKEGRKNVHAFVGGTLRGFRQVDNLVSIGTLSHTIFNNRITYNPYRNSKFVLVDSEESGDVIYAQKVCALNGVLTGEKIVVVSSARAAIG